MKRELFGLIVVLCVLLAFPASLFAYQAWLVNAPGMHVINLVGNSPMNGGWQPDTIRVKVGERVRLRIASTDVVHGFEIPALGVKVDEILPGHVEQVEFTATQVGRWPFMCTRWCSADHWRMRGVIEVLDPTQPNPVPSASAPPLYQQMQIDIDARHPAQDVPPERPSAVRGALLNLTISEDLRTLAPSEIFSKLRSNSRYQSYDDQELWDAMAYSYQQATRQDALIRGQALFTRDCAACHGEQGQGNGPAGRILPGLAALHPEARRGPADFTNAAQMLGASDVLLQGKILRGGMGTGMPEWGSLYTEPEMWEVIGYLRSFTFDFALHDPTGSQ